MLKTTLLSFLLLAIFMQNASASGFGALGNLVLKPLALSSCASHLKPYVALAKEREMCGCAWRYIISTKGEPTFVIKQVMQHIKDKKWQRVEKKQIMACVSASHETKTLTEAEQHNIKLAKWMNISSR
jgi:hypothetical protein